MVGTLPSVAHRGGGSYRRSTAAGGDCAPIRGVRQTGAVASALTVVIRVGGRTAGGMRRGARGFWRTVRAGVRAQGAGESGLAHLIDMQGVNAIGDTLVAVALAGTLFFAVPVGQARPRVALYLLIAMAPFALLAPVVGPTLDRFSHGRRYALATTMLGRAFLALIMAFTVHGLGLYPAAFGVLVLSKAYGVARAAAVPRLLPARVSLVAANSRLSLASIICATVAAPAGAGLAKLGPQWALAAAAVVFLFGIGLAIRVPARADSDQGETKLTLLPRRRGSGPRVTLGRPVIVALRSSAALRALSGFLILFLAFLLRTRHAGPHGTAALGAVVGAAALGSFIGTATGARLRLRRAQELQLGLLVLATAGCVAAVVLPGLPSAVALALFAGLTNSLGKLALDSVVQHEVAENVRNSAFARSETVLQLAWVAGGSLGLVPFGTPWGFVVAAAGLAAMVVWTAVSIRDLRPVRRQPAPASLPT